MDKINVDNLQVDVNFPSSQANSGNKSNMETLQNTTSVILQQTSTRAVYLAYHNGQSLGEFRGYGKTESERINSAREQAKKSAKAKQA